MPNIGATEHHIFYGDDSTGSSLASLAVDDSGNGDFTVGTDCIYSSSFASGDPCTIMVHFGIEFGSNPAGYIFNRYSGSTLMGIRYNGGSVIQLLISGSVAESLTVPSSGEYRVVIHWSMTDDPVNSGSKRSQVRAWVATSGDLIDGVDFTHSDPSVAGSDCIFGAQVTGGTNSAQVNWYGAGYLLHAIAPVQVRRDRIHENSAPTLTGDTAMEVPMPDWSSGFGEQDRSAGPTHWIGARAIAQNQLILVSPLVNKQWNSPSDITWTSLSSSAWWTLSPDGSSYLGLPFVWRRPVPKTVNYVLPRVFIQAGAGTGTVTVDVTAWSHNRNPGIDDEEPLVGYSQTESFGPVNDTTGGNEGRWLTFDPVRISRDQTGLWSWFSISVEMSYTGSDPRFEIRSVSFEPISDTDSDAIAGIGFG